MTTNFLALFGAALIPLIVGAIWYSPMVFGKTWMRVAGKTQEELEKGNMALIFGLTYILGVLLAMGLSGLTNHQSGVIQLFAMHPGFAVEGSQVKIMFDNIMTEFSNTHRTFGHGALHGGIAAIMIALPLIAINALFERRGAKYIGIHFGYWFLTLILIGGVVCQFQY
jgi:hypothetical protein